MKKISVAVLGATGTVGQKFITLLDGHPLFDVAELVASPRSAGKAYRDAANWKQPQPIPATIADKTVKSLDQKLESPVLFSGLDASVAGEAETRFAEAGHMVISNSRNHRMDPNVPIIIPEVNPDHFKILDTQPTTGKIVTNSNCSTMFLAMALAPLHRKYGLTKVQVTTLQAVSGGGYPGVPSLDILGNVVPYISGEEEKIEIEAVKILGSCDGKSLTPADFTVSAQCTRVPVIDGHTETVAFGLAANPSIEEVAETLRSFTGIPQEKQLPSAPRQPIIVTDEPDRPQPARDILLENGMATIVGRLRTCPIMGYKMVIMGHNTVRGAAGAAILNAETLHALGYIQA
ncbi:aspartate-semialdehyde dehydrogenase [Spirochaeta africana]|uniref:aspartate-semialdehyde dehydrogenase n=1 Tax=Spirochaeta africana (strain ATCC 700263 / DSM 8902 / Z-7692) TaxID=889378 RepID=H9UGQ3_SPIAZ|nr:aspartate-semialdehyde dehydrogenase [Spirochaeta africana]AFG36696.1 aspartate-semialdehyde dehydrogenase [Spirochaeta africana DSM 8902]